MFLDKTYVLIRFIDDSRFLFEGKIYFGSSKKCFEKQRLNSNLAGKTRLSYYSKESTAFHESGKIKKAIILVEVKIWTTEDLEIQLSQE